MSTEFQPPRILPPQWFLLSLAAVAALAWLLPATPHPGWLRWAGAVLALTGVAFAVAGSQLFARAGTSIIPLTRSSALVTHGVFNLSRNPMYLGMIAVLAGAALVLQCLWSWSVVAGFFLLIRQRFVLREEALLRQTFGAAYVEYCGRVRRWL